MIYLFFIIIGAFFSFCEYNGVFKNKKAHEIVGYYFLLILFICFAGIRYRVGGDTLAYIKYFDEMPTVDELASIDYLNSEYNPLWYVLNAIIKFIYNDFIFFQIVHAVIINTSIFYFFKKYSPNNKFTLVFFYFLFYYLYFNTEILRESLALSAFVLGYKYLLKKKWKQYYVLCIFCFLIHTSAIILFVLPFLQRKIKLIYLISIALFLALMGSINLVELIKSFNLPTQIILKSRSYLGREINIFGMLMQTVVVMPIIIVHLVRKKYKMREHIFEKNVLPFVYFGILSLFIGGFYRFLNYLYIINLVYFVDTLMLVSKQRFYFGPRVYMKFSMMFFFIYYGYFYMRDTSEYEPHTRFYNRYYPYHSIIDPKREVKRENAYYKMMNLNW
ncbi:hypothetical protein GNY06_08180 [Elizabethkingia argentiflava]|uniref:EpsG family protein n=1 Tax=Elizabethkingia argenteiflava TaxID=2681556 RepID=A0A845PSY4_9FLAO|nr:EpsG family protein [Elizabethkingia argenteiflava]NAW51359.1 hypothetical protein [Elizabethkingia argenteiflava]